MSVTPEPAPDAPDYPSPAEPRQPDKHRVPGAEPMFAEGLLDRVLEQTSQVWGHEDALSAQTLKRFRDVARRHPGHPLTANPIVRDLVEAILCDTFAALNQPDAFWRSTALTIAHTMMEDPYSQQRLNSVWSRLSEAVQCR